MGMKLLAPARLVVMRGWKVPTKQRGQAQHELLRDAFWAWKPIGYITSFFADVNQIERIFPGQMDQCLVVYILAICFTWNSLWSLGRLQTEFATYHVWYGEDWKWDMPRSVWVKIGLGVLWEHFGWSENNFHWSTSSTLPGMVLLWDWKVWRSSNSHLLSCPEMECLVKLKEPRNCKTLTITFHGILVDRDWTDYIKLSSITSAIKMSPQVTASRSLGLGTLALQRSRGRALWAVCSRQGLHNSCEVMWQSTVFGTDVL